jgi:uncharacterized protein (TIGR02147 family)
MPYRLDASKMNAKKTIFDYISYREYLGFRFEEKKIKNTSFSIRSAAMQLQINPGTLARVLAGTRNISIELSRRISEFLRLSKSETEYFEYMVLFDQAKVLEEKNKYLSKILSIRKGTVKVLENDQFEYFTKWHVIIIKEILSAYKFYGDFDELAKLVDPPITALEARQSVELLERLGIVRSENGLYIVDAKNLSTPDSWKSVAISNFQHSMIRLADEALDRFPKEKRDISTASMSISEEGIKKIKEWIKLFYQDVVDIVSEDTQSSKVYELNIQLFPISKNLPDQKK